MAYGSAEGEGPGLLPRFKLTSQFQLADVLKSMGMPLAFTPDRADFSGMDGRRDLFVSAVIHKAYVEVNEEGTEAAAATGIAVGATAVMIPKEPTGVPGRSPVPVPDPGEPDG